MQCPAARIVFAATLLVPLLGQAQGDTAPQEEDAGTAARDQTPQASEADRAAAQKLVDDYLTAVKAKKWDVARRLIHPRTLEVIADIKKRKGFEDHELAPWEKVGEEYLTAYDLSPATDTAKGAVVVLSTESHYSVEDKGVEDGVKAEYLVLPLDGKWYVADRRLGENRFPSDTLPAAYKGYFQGEYVPAPVAPTPTKKTKKKKPPPASSSQ